MNEIYLQVENQEQVDRILAVLQEAEEQGELDFPFTTRTALSEGQDLKGDDSSRPSDPLWDLLEESDDWESEQDRQTALSEGEDLKGW